MSLTKFNAQYLPYHETHAFTNIVEDYLKGEPALKDFYQHSPDIVGIKEAISVRKNYNYNRNLLVKELFKQYDSGTIAGKVKANIEALLSDNTFTICTAHQPNIFTGHLYFIYKILHAIKLAEELNEKIAGYNFVPVYYMGSEDADLEELGEICINGKNYKWSTDQKGAVGRMKVDTIFIDLINEIDGQLSVEPFGKEIISLLRQSYSIGKTIQQSTFELVNKLFEDKGLIIFLPDNSELKKEFFPVNQKELLEQFSQKAVAETVAAFPGKYKVKIIIQARVVLSTR